MARPRRSGGTRKKLLEEGVKSLLRRGYHGSGLMDVLGRVGVPKGSFYNYFPSKEAFGAEVLRHYGAAFDARLDAMLEAASEDAVAALDSFFRTLAREYVAAGFHGGCLVGNLGGELEDSEVCRKAMVDAVKGWRDRIASAIELGQRQRAIRRDVEPAELADLVLNGWEGAVLRMKIERSAAPMKQWRARVLGDWLRS